jgi:hypothetical protein
LLGQDGPLLGRVDPGGPLGGPLLSSKGSIAVELLAELRRVSDGGESGCVELTDYPLKGDTQLAVRADRQRRRGAWRCCRRR